MCHGARSCCDEAVAYAVYIAACMKTLIIGVVLALHVPTTASADSPPAKSESRQEGRLVPVMLDGKPIGLKVYAIRPGGRFDQPTARFQNGDTIESVDGLSVLEEAGAVALYGNVIGGNADATVVVLRHDERITLASKAARRR